MGTYQERAAKLETIAPQCREECKHLLRRLKQEAGLDVRFGEEIEFTLDGNWNTEKVEQIRSQALDKLDQDLKAAGEDRKKAKPIKEKIEAVKAFGAKELFMFDCIEMDERTKNIVHYLFGKDEYYDNRDVLELQIKHVPFDEFHSNRATLLMALQEKARAFGGNLTILSSHPHKSLWREGVNLNCVEHPRYLENTGREMEGTLATMYHLYPVLINDKQHCEGLGVCTDRSQIARICRDSTELRVQNKDPVFCNIDISLMTMLAGAYTGLILEPAKKRAAAVISYETVQVPVAVSIGNPKDTSALRHMLNGSKIKADGSLALPTGHLFGISIKVLGQLGIGNFTKETLADMQSAVRADGKVVSRFAEQVSTLLSDVRLIKAGTGYTFIPAPQKSGNDTIRKICKKINSTIRVDGLIKVPHIPADYSFYPSDGEYAPAQFTARFEESHLKDVLTPETYRDIDVFLQAEYGTPTDQDRLVVKDMRREIRSVGPGRGM